MTSDLEDDALLEALGVEAAPLTVSSRTAREERIIAGFEDILKFYESHGRVPQHGEGRDIFERLYAVRLDQIRKLPEALDLLETIDVHGFLASDPASTLDINNLDEDALLAALGVEQSADAKDDITLLRHVRPYAKIKAAEEIANRTPCKDFDRFKQMFEVARTGLKDGTWLTKPFTKDASIELFDYFILGGQLAYVAEILEDNLTKDGRDNPRLRVIFDNGTETDLLLRSLSRSLYPDGNTKVGQRLIRRDEGPLFSTVTEPDDIESGSIYVLRSKSDHPYVVQYRELIHKIGVTGGKVSTRIAGAEKDATYLLAEVEVVATYKLHNISRTKLENIFHRLFAAAQIDLTIKDRFGTSVKPREWFLVPLNVINEAVERIIDGSITEFAYDLKVAALVLNSPP